MSDDNPYSPPSDTVPESRWSWSLWILCGVLAGLALRLLTPWISNGAMSLTFLVGAPLLAGALTQFGLRRYKPSWTMTVFAPWLTIALMMAGFSITGLEGSICLVIMSPLFAALASLGAVLLRWALPLFGRERRGLQAVGLLPFLLFAVDHAKPLDTQLREVRRSVHVNAPAEVIFRNILDARDIRPDELPRSLSHAIGVPKPVEGVNRMTPQGEVRFSRWERGVQFRGIVTDKQPNRSIAWRYAFDAHSFPPGSMDDHVAIGGRYFDLQDTRFNLTPEGSGTRLEIIAHYRVTSSINAYAAPLAHVLGVDFVDTILGFYKHRSEQSQHPARA